MPLRRRGTWLGKTNSDRKRRLRPRMAALALEHLEDRSTPAVVLWDGGGGDLNWFNQNNWTNDTLPTLADDVIIDGAAGAVTINNTFGTALAGTLNSASSLHVISGTLQLAGDSLVSGGFLLGGVTFGGVVTGSGTLTLTGNVTWGANGVMAGTGTTVLAGTTTLEGTAFGSIRQDRIVQNVGSATLLAGNSFTLSDSAQLHNLAGGTLTFEANAGIGTFFANAASKLLNEGTLIVSGPGTTGIGVLTENSGTLEVVGANLNLSGLNNSGSIEVTAGDLTVAGVIDNAGTVAVSGGNLSAATGASSGDVQLADGATMTVTGNAFTLLDGAGVTGGPIVVNTFAKLAVSGDVAVDAISLTGGTLETAAGGSLTVATLAQNGTVTGPGTTTVTDQWTFSGGTVTGGGRLVTAGTSTFSGGFSTRIDNAAVENAGMAIVDAGASFTFANGGNWTNLPGSLFEVRTNSFVDTFFTGPTAQLLNQGTVLKTGVGNATIELPLVNAAGGLVQVEEGTLQLTGGGSSAAAFNIASGAALRLSGSYTLEAGASSPGAGELVFAGGPFGGTLTVVDDISLTNLRVESGTIAGAGTLTLGTLTVAGSATVNTALDVVDWNFSSGTLTGTGTVTVNGVFTWTDGTMSGSGTIFLNGTATIGGGSSTIVLDGRTVENAGTVAVQTTNLRPLQFRGSAVWNNLAGSEMELQGPAVISNFFATGSVNSAGTIRKTGAGSVATIGVPLLNTGVVEILGGDLSTAANSRSSSLVDIAADARWVANNAFLDAGATTTGAGLVLLSSGTLTVTDAASVARLQQNSGTLRVDGSLIVGDYIFNGGTLTGSGQTTLTGMSSFTGNFTRTVSSHTVENAGTVIWSGSGPIQMTNGSVFNNLAGALFDITSSAQFLFSGSVSAFHNAGTLQKSGGGLTTWRVPLVNSGTLDVRSGNLAFNPLGLPAGVSLLTNTGTIRVGTAMSPAATITLPVTSVFPNPASYTLTGGTLTGTGVVVAANLVIAPGATLAGTVTVQGNLENRGTVQPDSTPGELTVTGNYLQVDDATADGRLVIGLRGDSGSGLFGKLKVNGTSQLAGALEVFADGAFLPDFGDVFQVFQSIGPRNGDFTYPAGGYDLDGYRVLSHEYDSTGRRLNLLTEVGPLPVIDAIEDVTVNEGELVAFTVTATGAEPPGPLTFSLVEGSSPGATIDPVTGAFEFLASAGPNVYVFQIAASDPNAPFNPVDVETFMVTVLNVAPQVAITGGQAELAEGDQFTAAGAFIDPGADSWTATVDYGDGTGVNPLSLNPDKTFALNHTYLDNGNFTITVRVFDGFEHGEATFDVAVQNLAPTVTAAGDQSATEGGEQQFDLGSFSDFGLSDEPWTVKVDWGDGSQPLVFETFTQGALGSVPYTYADSGLYTVTVTVTDKDGAAASDTFQVAVGNLAPAAEVTGPSSAVRGQQRSFLFSAIDPSAVDQMAEFTFSIDWGDGHTQVVSGLSGLAVEHTFAEAGLYAIAVTATDKDGAVSEVATHTVSVVVAEVQDGVLVVGGTTGADDIQVKNGTGDGMSLEVVINGVSLGEFGNLTRAIVYGQDGDDDLNATGSTDVALELYGGGGNDRLQGGSKDDILDGGEGDDELIGGHGRDVLIGGAGADRLISQAGEDILIGGLFLPDDPAESRRAALLAIAAVWSSDDAYDDRVADLLDDLLLALADDGISDSLTGAAGTDWYFARTSGPVGELDQIHGTTGSEEITSI